MSRFAIEVEWLDDPGDDVAFGPERDTWARLSISIDGDCLTRNRPAEGLLPGRTAPQEDTVEGGLSGLAEWVVENWPYVTWEARTPYPRAEPLAAHAYSAPVPGLRDASKGWADFAIDEAEATLLAGWQQRHTLGANSSPVALPSIVLGPEVRHVLVSVDGPPVGFGSDVAFVPPGLGWPALYVLPKDEVQDGLSGLVEDTLRRADRAERSQPWTSWLRTKWTEVQGVARDPGFRRRQLLGGWLAERWEAIRERNGELAEPVEGIAIDSEPIEDDGTISALLEISRRTIGSEAGAWTERVSVPPVDISRPLFEQGYVLAREVRKRLGRRYEPLVNLGGALAELEVETLDPVPIDGFRTAVIAGRRAAAAIVPSSNHPRMEGVAGFRFAVAAALGRLVAAAHTQANIGAAHGESARALETRRANAFAAEFLLPREALRRHAETSSVEELVSSDLCDEYGISRSAAAWHARNHGFKGAP